MPITDPSKTQGLCSSLLKTTKGFGKSITTSVPSIAVRFHSGDEELDIYPSADDEDDGEKDEFRSSSGLGTVASSSPPSNASPSMQSRDPSPMKEYLKGLGKRSTSVDANIMDVGSSGSDTWRIFQELKGKITKTVEEKLTEIKSERRSATPLFSGKSSPRHGRLRAGANSPENSSVSDSEDVSETSNKDESRTPQINEPGPPVLPPITSHSLPFTPSMFPSDSDLEESPRKKGKKDRKSGLRNRKGNEIIEMSSLPDDESDSENKEVLEDIEPAVEVSEETKFASEHNFYDDIPTIDYTVYPPVIYTPTYIDVRRKSSVTLVREPKPSILKKVWAFRNIILAFIVFMLLFFIPIPSYFRGMIVGVLLTLLYHVIVGVKHWYMPRDDISIPKPFTKLGLTNYAELPILEVPLEPEVEVICKYGGWMNELTEEYDPDTYHINNTQSVYVKLNGSIMRISHPKAKIPKRHLWNERKLKMKFIHQRIYDIADCSIKLLPEGMTRKRRWSKKYPLCITLTKEAKRRETVVVLQPEPERDPIRTVSQTSSLGDETVDQGGVDEVVILKPYVDDHASDTSILSRLSVASTISLMDRDEGSGVSVLGAEGSLLSTFGKDEEETISFSQIREKLFVSKESTQSDEETFCMVDEQQAKKETVLYLFSRTDRQKEDWYRKFIEAMKATNNEGDEDEDDFEAAREYQDRRASPQPGVSEITLEGRGGGHHDKKASPQPGVSDIALGGRPHHLDRRTSTVPGVSDVALGGKRDGEYAFDDSCYANVEFVSPSALRNADMNYIEFMNKFHLQVTKDRKGDKLSTSLKLDREVDCDVMWVNVFVGRILFDVLQNPKWIDKIQGKIQKKISTIKLPLFVEELLLTGIDLGRDVPMIHRASRPIIDDHGLWVDLDVTFDGCIMLTIETKINLMKMKKEDLSAEVVDEQLQAQPPLEEEGGDPEKRKSPIYDSSVEDSAESSPTETEEEHGVSSSDDATPEIFKYTASTVSVTKTPTPSTVDAAASHLTPAPSPTPSTVLAEKKKAAAQAAQGKGVIKMMNKFVSSQFFQSAAEYRYIKRAIEGVSNTQITLTVEIRACTGQLAVNFPPPPSDRVWFGFRGNPRIWIVVKPKFGQRQVNISYITNWLEKKLLLEFQKKFVLPNMDDLVIKPMSTDLPV